MSWIYLTLAIVLEVAGTTSMKLSEGFANLVPSVLIFVFYAISFGFLVLALNRLELSVTYAIWSGLGTALTALIGFWYFGEAVTPLKLASIGLIIAGVVGLQLGGGEA
ncbi:MAG: multidrug efflux SMR transporter [Alphaproteobacteria bacterium]|nr:multidrug efflux SMR transporter [Alphaproteobacteria bacterium]